MAQSNEHGVQAALRKIAGVECPHGFRLRNLFAFKAERDEADARLSQTSRSSEKVSAEWPRSPGFSRILLLNLAVVTILALSIHVHHNALNVPAFIIAGAFAVPVACVAFFFDLNVLRNISVGRTAVLLVLGGLLSFGLPQLPVVLALSPQIFGIGIEPLCEELAKLFMTVLLMGQLRRRRWILNGVLAGAAVGAGFHGLEVAAYLYESLLMQTGEFYPTLIWRALYAPFCHVAYTALAAGALWMAKGDGPFQFSTWFRWRFLRIFILVVALHTFWNEFYGNSAAKILLLARISVEITLAFISAYLVLAMVQTGLSEVRNAQLASHESTASPIPD